MDMFLMIRCHKTTIFLDAKKLSTVFELKHIVEDILKRPPEERLLYKDDQLLDDGKTLGECGFTSQTAQPQWAWPSEKMTPSKLSALSPSPALPSFQM
jgi:transcription elongation factor B subunit 2